jgi:hypothetical protein
MGRSERSSSVTETVNPLHKTAPDQLIGTVHYQWVRCGHANCRCARGQEHGPYAFHFFRVHGHLHKRYVPKAEAAAISAACDRRRELETVQRRLAKAARQGWQEMLVPIREGEIRVKETTS